MVSATIKSLVLLILLGSGANALEFAYKKMLKDPLKSFCSSHGLEEGSDIYVLKVDFNRDGLDDIMITSKYQKNGYENDDDIYPWNVFIRVKGGYKRLMNPIGLNINYVAVAKNSKGYTGLATFEKIRAKGFVSIQAVEPSTEEGREDIEMESRPVKFDSAEFRSIFANNLAKTMKVIPQEKITGMYSISVFPKGKIKEYNETIRGYKTKRIQKMNKNIDTTATLRSLGIEVDSVK